MLLFYKILNLFTVVNLKLLAANSNICSICGSPVDSLFITHIFMLLLILQFYYIQDRMYKRTIKTEVNNIFFKKSHTSSYARVNLICIRAGTRVFFSCNFSYIHLVKYLEGETVFFPSAGLGICVLVITLRTV